MTDASLEAAIADFEAYLETAEAAILPTELAIQAPPLSTPVEGPLRVGVDLGTAYLVVVVLDASDRVLLGEYQFAEVARDGLVVDFIGAVDRVREIKGRLEERMGRELEYAASGYPPGVPQAEVRATGNVLESAGLHCTGLVPEPSAANAVVGLSNGAIVDVGGGTTGVAVIRDGEVVYTADEATGGTHFSLVIAGALNLSFEAAEALKKNLDEQSRLFPLVRPVMEKVGSITARHVGSWPVPEIVLVGGAAAFPGFAEVIREYSGLPIRVPSRPLFITPLGIARHCRIP